jgi:hypothetical protein
MSNRPAAQTREQKAERRLGVTQIQSALCFLLFIPYDLAMRNVIQSLLCLLTTAAAIIGLMGSAVASSMHDLVSDDEYSLWGMRDVAFPFVPAGAEPTFDPARDSLRDYGCFPMGNGRIFGHLGVDSDFSLLRGLTGPGYQTRGDEGEWQVWQEGNWPDIPVSFKATAPKGPHEPVFHLGDKWTTQSIEQVRGGAIVRVKQSADFGELSILQYAVPELPVLIREYRFTPVAGRADADWDYFLQLGGSASGRADDGFEYEQGDNRLTIRCQSIRKIPEMPQCIAGEMQADGSWQCTLVYIVGKTDQPRAAVDLDESAIEEMATRTLNWWCSFSAANYQPHTGDSKLDDMLIQLPVTIETQRDYYSGSSSPMVSYHGCWVRDNNGIILTDIVNQRFDKVMRLLRYHRAACVQYGHVPMMIPLDLDLSELEGWQPGAPGTAGNLSAIGATGFDWYAFGVEHAEVPSLIVIQHFLLWRAMHQAGQGADADEFISEAWGFITHNLTAMEYSTEYGVKFHGDETYAGGALYSTYDQPESGQIGWPNGYIPTEFYSFDNTILHRAAAAAIIEMAGASGWDGGVIQANRIIDELDSVIADNYIVDGRIVMAISPITGQQWLPPFSNISLRPYWLNLYYANWQDNIQVDNYWRIRELLHGPDNPQSTPWSGYQTGHSPGYLLSAARSYGYVDDEEACFAAMQRTASPEGAFCEVLGPDGLPVDIYGRTNRIRPWESGVNYEAIVSTLQMRTVRRMSPQPEAPELPPEPPVATASHDTELLAITRDKHFREVIGQDFRLAKVDSANITAWDIGLPFSPDELYRALMFEEGDIDYHIPFLFFDRDVRGGLDRRTMKDERFWAEIDKVLADYEAAGGIVLTEDTLRPAWEAELERDADDNSFRIDIEGPDGNYDWKLQTAHQPSLIEQRLQQDGLLPSIAYAASGHMDKSGNAMLGLAPEQFTLLQNESMKLEVVYTDETGNEFRYTHMFPGTQRMKDRLNAIDTEALPEYAIRAYPQGDLLPPREEYESGKREMKLPISYLLNHETGSVFFGAIDNREDAELVINFYYDSENLYISIAYRDDKTPGSGTWDSDRINLCFDALLDSDDTDYPKGAVSSADWQTDDYWVFACPFIDDEVKVMRLGGKIPGLNETGFNGPVAGSKVELAEYFFSTEVTDSFDPLVDLLPSGHMIHWSIPLSELPYLDATPGSFCGLTIFYSDMDESLSEMMYFNDWGDGQGGIEWRFWDTGLLYFDAP